MDLSNNQTIHFRKTGSGAPVFILHGLFGSEKNWQSIVHGLSENYTVFSLDMRNHGQSFHSDQFNYEVMADDVLRLIRRLGLQDVSLIGHSMGGKVAMKFAFRHPDLVNRLVVVDMANKAYDDPHQSLIEALYSLDVSKISRLRDADDMLQQAIPQREMRLFLISNLKRDSNGGYDWQINMEGIRNNYQKLCKKIHGKSFKKPCMFIRGGNSEYIEDADWPEIQKEFPSAVLVTIPNAGHWVHFEAQDEFLNSVLTFFKK